LNPVIPDARYNCKLGLGTPLEQRLNPGGFNQSESSNGKPPMTEEEIKKEAEDRLNALPSYLKKKQIDQSEEGLKSKKNEIIPFEDMVQIKTKFKMREMDLNLEKLKDRDYLRLIKVIFIRKNFTDTNKCSGEMSFDSSYYIDSKNV